LAAPVDAKNKMNGSTNSEKDLTENIARDLFGDLQQQQVLTLRLNCTIIN
jgi:hypothetical protein